MSEKKYKQYVAAGVFKVDYKAAGYPDLLKLAQEWAQDPHFYELIVRKVSEDNFGIQFVYISNDPENSNIKKYKKDLLEKYPKEAGGVYAWDYHESSIDTDGKDKIIESDMIVVLKGVSK